MVFRVAIIGLLLGVSIGTAIAAEPGLPQALTRKLAEFPGAERGTVIPVKDDVIARVCPGYAFYVLRFLQYPVVRMPPARLSASNLFVLKPGGSVDVLRDAVGLETFFRAMLAPTRTEDGAKDTVVAWLRLTQEFRQDGFFQFSIDPGAVQVTSLGATALLATGKAIVDPRGGNMGEIDAALTFDTAGKLERVSETANLKRGIRPICQATKLLDADLVVRRMAEQDLLLMGKAAGDYLAGQRAKADRKLQHAIDRIWERILAEDR
jgi:hypothetical protein